MLYLALENVVARFENVVSRFENVVCAKIGKSLIRLRFRYLGCICGSSRGGFFFLKTNLRFFADTLYHLYQFVSELSVRI